MSKYNINTHGDFSRWYDTYSKRNYWLLGYFGGGGINVSEAMELAKQFSELTNTPLDTVCIDVVHNSRWCKHFKYIYSTQVNQLPEKTSTKRENVWNMFHS